MFKHTNFRIKIIRLLNKYITGLKSLFIFNIIISLLDLLIILLIPLLYKIFIDEIIINMNFKLLKMVILMYIAFSSIQIIISYTKYYINNRIRNRFEFRIKSNILKRFLKKDYEYIQNQDVGNMSMIINNDVDYLNQFIEKQTIDYYINIFKIIISIVFSLKINWLLGIILLITIPITFFLDNFISNKEKIHLTNIRNTSKDIVNNLKISFENWRIVKFFNLQKKEKEKYNKLFELDGYYFGKWINYWVIRVFIIPTLKDQFLYQFILYFVGGIFIINGKLTIGSLIIFSQYFIILTESLIFISTCESEINSYTNHINPIMKILEDDIIQIKKNDHILEKNINSIQMKNVSLTYKNTGINILKNINLDLSLGDRACIIGESGIGKTTLIKLLLTILHPDEGDIFFFDINSKEIDKEFVKNQISVIMQDSIIFNDTIIQNIMYAKGNATINEVEDACKKAQIFDFINSLPLGFNTVIGEKGIKLSGGQKQRILLSRMFLTNASMYILDEPTSAIDEYTEKLIYNSLYDLSKNKILIIITHRKTNLTFFNKIFEIDNGNLK